MSNSTEHDVVPGVGSVRRRAAAKKPVAKKAQAKKPAAPSRAEVRRQQEEAAQQQLAIAAGQASAPPAEPLDYQQARAAEARRRAETPADAPTIDFGGETSQEPAQAQMAVGTATTAPVGAMPAVATTTALPRGGMPLVSKGLVDALKSVNTLTVEEVGAKLDALQAMLEQRALATTEAQLQRLTLMAILQIKEDF